MRRREFLGVLGSYAAWPTLAKAQPVHSVKRLAMVHAAEKPADMVPGGRPSFKALFEELNRLGYVEGQNLQVLRFSAEGHQDRYAAVAREAVDAAPDAILSMHARLALAFKSLTSKIPVVAVNSDHVALGLVPSLARPGGNITGVSVDAGLEIWGKRLSTLAEATGKLSKPYFLTTQQQWDGPTGNVIRVAAKRLGLPLFDAILGEDIDQDSYARPFQTMRENDADGLVVSEVSENITFRRAIVNLAAQQSLPAIYPYRDFVAEGGLLAYAIDLVSTYRRLADQIVSIFAGTNPGDIPVFQQTTFQLIANIKAAHDMGLVMPPTLLARVDEVIE